MSSIVVNKAVAWAVDIANDEDHGYDQNSRWGPDYDCSSLVISAYQFAGVPVKSSGASYTGNMVKVFKNCGFQDVTAYVNLNDGSGLMFGDVVWKNGHVEMVCGNGLLVGASINEHGTTTGGQEGDQTGKEIRVRSYYNYPWTVVLRYASKNKWTSGNRYLSKSEQQNNALIIYDFMKKEGWSINAIAALLGNMEVESTINPGIWESLATDLDSYYNANGRYPGFGLVQWTPYTKYSDWAGSDWRTNHDDQLRRIIYEMENGLQYIATSSYPETFREFSTSTKSAYYLAGAFLYNYERPKKPNAADRGERAEKWLTFLKQYSNYDPEEPPEDGELDSENNPYNNADFIDSFRPLTSEEVIHNGKLVWKFFHDRGWSRNAICAVLANMERVSTVNPGYCDGWTFPPNASYGLLSWSPPSKIINWVGDFWAVDYYAQLWYMVYELENNLQYRPTSQFPETFEEFATSNKDESYLAGAFGANYIGFTEESTFADLGERAAGWWNLVVEWEQKATIPVWLLFKIKGVI